MTDFVEVTELSGEEVSQEQVQRACVRYGWALQYCGGKDVLEIACGSGPGLGVLAATARTLVAGDISDAILARARAHYGNRVDLRAMDAQQLPFADASLDVILIFEALYYIPSAERFVAECKRVLRPGGRLLISNANKDLSDFNPSPHSHVYHGVVELGTLLAAHGFSARFYGDVPIAEISMRQRILRPIKKLAISLGLIPKSMAGKRLLKRLVFGNLTTFPSEIAREMLPAKLDITELDPGKPDARHKVILCAANV
jgi:ubiquinone/menaquinone biosynthesis C-methylase UbiE